MTAPTLEVLCDELTGCGKVAAWRGTSRHDDGAACRTRHWCDEHHALLVARLAWHPVHVCQPHNRRCHIEWVSVAAYRPEPGDVVTRGAGAAFYVVLKVYRNTVQLRSTKRNSRTGAYATYTATLGELGLVERAS